MSVKGFRRVASGGACAFCQMLASRGGVYSKRGANFEAHDGCTCSAEPIFHADEQEPPDVIALRELWDRSTRGLSGKDALNAFRRAQAAGGKASGGAAKFHRSTVGLEDLAAIVEEITLRPGSVAGKRRLMGGESAEVQVLTLLDRRTIIKKRAHNFGDDNDVLEQADAEQLTALVAQALEAPVARVYRTEKTSVWMEHVRDAENAGDPSLIDSPEGHRLGVLDMLVGNLDRSDRNWLADVAGRLVGIDHGQSWYFRRLDEFNARREAGHVDQPIEIPARTEDNPFSSRVLARRLLSRRDVEIIRERLEKLRPDFVKIGRGAWLDWTLRMLDILPTGTGEGIYG